MKHHSRRKISDTERLDWLMAKISPAWATAWQPRTRSQVDGLMAIDAAIRASGRGCSKGRSKTEPE